MTVSRRSFFGLAAAAPFAAPEIVRAARAEFDNMNARALFGEIKPLSIPDEVRRSVIELKMPNLDHVTARIRGEFLAMRDMGIRTDERVAAIFMERSDPAVIDQMRDHDIFEFDRTPKCEGGEG